MAKDKQSPISFPANPLDQVQTEEEYKRRMVLGVLESYNGNYDILAELVQNAIDAVEDALILALDGPYEIHVHIDLKNNRISVRDTGIGMRSEDAIRAFAPSITFKTTAELVNKRGRSRPYRGYKGVGLTFLAYGTDEIKLHTRHKDGEYVAAKMQYGNSWATGQRSESALIVEDTDDSPLDGRERGTYVSVQLSKSTRPRQLSGIASEPEVWRVILLTRTAIGQINLVDDEQDKIVVHLTVTDSDGREHTYDIDPTFLLPNLVQREPEFRFLNLPQYFSEHQESASIPIGYQRQDGIYLVWNTERIRKELSESFREQFKDELDKYTPTLYAFLPYHAAIWQQINEVLTGVKNRKHLNSGLVLAINRQRLADTFELFSTRYETLGRNLFVLIHFDNAKPDQGRKTVQDEVLELAKRAGDRALQYLAVRRDFLKPPGDAPTPNQREVEKDHSDWEFNVRTHAKNSPLHIPPVAFQSEPLTEQDVVGLFHQLSALGVFPGIKVFATSQHQTYDSLVSFECDHETRGLQFKSVDKNPLGLSPFILGDSMKFSTKYLTLEFKNNLDALIGELDGDSPKDFGHIDICVCWSQISDSFKGYEIEEITAMKIDERRYPGATHLLRKDGHAHVIQVFRLKDIVDLIRIGRAILPAF